jgi:hypothetical protein
VVCGLVDVPCVLSFFCVCLLSAEGLCVIEDYDNISLINMRVCMYGLGLRCVLHFLPQKKFALRVPPPQVLVLLLFAAVPFQIKGLFNKGTKTW